MLLLFLKVFRPGMPSVRGINRQQTIQAGAASIPGVNVTILFRTLRGKKKYSLMLFSKQNSVLCGIPTEDMPY